MKFSSYSIALTFSFLFLASSLIAQERLKPSKTETLATFTFLQPDKQPYANLEILFKGNKGSNIKARTNASGLVKVLLPNNEDFTTRSGEYFNGRLIKTGNKAYSAIGGQRYTHKFIEYSFYYTNLKGEGVKGELVTILSNTGKTYTKTTLANGLALFHLPIEATYTLNLTYHPDVRTIEVPDAGHSFVQMNYTFRGVSSYEKEQADIRREERVKERAKAQIQAAAQEKTTQEALEVKRTKDAAQKAREDKAILAGAATRVVFFASQPEYKGVGTITVYDGGKEGAVIGSINSVWSCMRGPEKEGKIEAYVVKSKGTYTYYAKSAQGVEWSGTYEILGGEQKNIPLRIKDK
ncbi:MAG: Unknown protein [uncultured Aureispira sp.]|uniref:Uncharacterized protein n=1 Tax=uncultured Aureispira sp. TaxID=1331704 RepID=A0A6S6TER6_9BACT|nr:MAG: Unknown protein [uncultured Aureispira sp.]